MWIFTPYGFFSAVTDRNNHNRLLIRTRARKDLDEFRKNYCRRLGPTIDSKQLGRGSDYPFRAFVGKKAFSNAMSRVIADMTYGNFKSSVKDNTRHNVYMDVWSTMSRAERNGKLDGSYRAPVSSRSLHDWDDTKVSDLAGAKQGNLFGTWDNKGRRRPPSSAPTHDELRDMGYTDEQIEDPFYVSGGDDRDKDDEDDEDDDFDDGSWDGDTYVYDPDARRFTVEPEPAPDEIDVQLDNLWSTASHIYDLWDDGEGEARDEMLADACRAYLRAYEESDPQDDLEEEEEPEEGAVGPQEALAFDSPEEVEAHLRKDKAEARR